MINKEKVIKGLTLCTTINKVNPVETCGKCPYFIKGNEPDVGCIDILMLDALELLKEQEPITGETSDGYHTFNELYHHRAVLFSVIVANYPERAWKAKKHHDGTMYDGMFIVGIDTPDGQATYHYDIDPYWDMFNCRVLENAPEWDGHTPAQAIERIGKLKAQEPRVLTLEEIKDYDKPVWIDEKVRGSWKLPFYAFDLDLYAIFGYECFSIGDYGKEWLPWTSKPTDEQRKAVKWDCNEPPKEDKK